MSYHTLLLQRGGGEPVKSIRIVGVQLATRTKGGRKSLATIV